MAQFMDSRVSPIKIKIWRAEVGASHKARLAYPPTPLVPIVPHKTGASLCTTTLHLRKQRGHTALPATPSGEGPRLLGLERRHSTFSLL